MKSARLLDTTWYLCLLASALCIAFIGTPWENTLTLAAAKKIDLAVALFYRYRDASIALDGSFAYPALPIFLALVNIIGVRTFWILTILLQALAFRRCKLLRWIALALLVCAVIFGESLLVWSLFFSLSYLCYQKLFSKSPMREIPLTLLILLALVFSIQLAWVFGNPTRFFHRQQVLGGRSYADVLAVPNRLAKIELAESCTAVFNPDDLRGVQSVELLARDSLSRFAEFILLDLKVVEANYPFLKLKNESGSYVFSDAARAFAAKEKEYAAPIRARLETLPNLCLIAAFDQLPEQEQIPYSRAREILEIRKRKGLKTRVIQLPSV